MERDFSKQFHMLIKEDVQRKFLKQPDDIRNGLKESIDEKTQKERLPVPEDGFVACYCSEKNIK